MISFKRSIHKRVLSVTMTMMLAASTIFPVTAAEQGGGVLNKTQQKANLEL